MFDIHDFSFKISLPKSMQRTGGMIQVHGLEQLTLDLCLITNVIIYNIITFTFGGDIKLKSLDARQVILKKCCRKDEMRDYIFF